MQTINIKQGDSFGFSMDFKKNGVAISGEALNLKCQIRNKQGELIDEMIISESDIPGTYIFRANSTANWVNILYFDLQYKNADNIILSSETVRIKICEDVTK